MMLLKTIFCYIELLVFSIIAGLLGSLTGLGGGTVLVPLLTLFLGIPIAYAAGASLISTIATSSGAVLVFVIVCGVLFICDSHLMPLVLLGLLGMLMLCACLVHTSSLILRVPWSLLFPLGL